MEEKNVNISEGTYITKEQFLNMIQGLNFTHIERADIEFITAFKINNEEDTVKPKGFKIYIS